MHKPKKEKDVQSMQFTQSIARTRAKTFSGFRYEIRIIVLL